MPTLKATISLSAFRHNLKVAQKIVGKHCAILPVIKADAYGHGMVPIAREALKSGVPMLAIGTVSEGRELRRAKIASPILVLDGIFKEDIETVIKQKLTPVIFSLETASAINRMAKKAGKKVAVHIKFDTGMSRLGFPFARYKDIFGQLKKYKNLAIEGLMTHLASSADISSPQTDLQINRFKIIIETAKEQGVKPKWIHAANSGGILNYPGSHFNMARPGIMLYGQPPSPVKGVTFKPVMTISSRIISVKTIPSGEGIGYNATYVTPRSKKVAVIMGGYGDGINRLLSNRGTVLWKGKPLPVIGNICMDNFMVDLSKAQLAKPGDEVILLGADHDKVSVKVMADICGTISYEILCSLGTRAKKLFK